MPGGGSLRRPHFTSAEGRLHGFLPYGANPGKIFLPPTIPDRGGFSESRQCCWSIAKKFIARPAATSGAGRFAQNVGRADVVVSPCVRPRGARWVRARRDRDARSSTNFLQPQDRPRSYLRTPPQAHYGRAGGGDADFEFTIHYQDWFECVRQPFAITTDR